MIDSSLPHRTVPLPSPGGLEMGWPQTDSARGARVLIVDDDVHARKIARDILKPLELSIDFAEDGRSALALLERATPDLVLLDLMMPEVDGFEVLRTMRGDPRLRVVPVIIVSAWGDRDIRLRGLSLGADDFVNKPFDRDELRARVATSCRINRTRLVAEARERFETVVRRSPDGILVVDEALRVISANRAMDRMFGLESAHTLVGATLASLLPLSVLGGVRALLAEIRSQDADGQRIETRLSRQLLPPLDVEIAATGIPFGEGRAALLVVRDISERLRLQHQVQQLQKVETLGAFAAEIAHDFGNLLSGAQHVVHSLERGARARGEAIPSEAADLAALVRSGAEMTRHLLAFVRQAPEEVHLLDPIAFFDEFRPIGDRLLSQGHVLSIEVAPSVGFVRIGRAQLEQVVLNLLVNARDAMTATGRVDISVASVGTQCEIVVRDTGPGIAPEERQRIFEPFVSGRAGGAGSGLGLATVARIVRGAGGTIEVSDNVPHGAVFTVRLPQEDVRPRG